MARIPGRTLSRAVALGACVWLAWGCDDPAEPAGCTPGETRACVCSDGAEGAQICDEAGAAFAACACTPPADGAVDRALPDRGIDAAVTDVGPDAGGDVAVDGAVDGDPPDAAPACRADDDCPGGQACAEGICVEPAVCAADDDCLGPRLCNDGLCLDPCAGDAGCPGTRVCVDQRCVEGDTCFDPTDCAPGRICLDGACDDPCGPARACPDGLICGEGGRCAEDPDGCADDAGCIDERLCAAGACVDPCLEDAACPGNRSCVAGLCPEAEPCLAPEDCDAARTCVEAACRPDCGGGLPACPDGLVCDADLGACRPDDGCVDDAGCPVGEHCRDGRCASACADDADCPGARSCDGARGRCVEAEPCFAPEDCDPGRVCEDFSCVAVCDANADCPGAQRCDGGRCVEPERCGGDVDCLGARLCQGGTCGDPCGGDLDCAGDQRCVDARCAGAEPCASDLDCPGVERCRDVACRPPDCALSADCPAGVCLDAVCAAEPPFACSDAAPCRPGQICAGPAVCAPDGGCIDDAECPGRAPICDGIGRCVACVVDAHCAAAERCEGNRCVPGAACDADADCPGSRVCIGGICAPADGCVDDGRGDARPPEVLDARAHAGLRWCDDTLDRFRVDVPAGEGRVIALRHGGFADLALTVTAAGDPADVLGADDGPHGFDRVVVPVAVEARAVDVRISGRPGFDADYALVIDRLDADDCAPDAFEGPHGNDNADGATPLTDDVQRLETTLCPGDADWFALAAVVGVDWRIRAVPEDGTATLVLLDPNGVEVARGEAIDGAAVLNHGPTRDGLYRLGLTADRPTRVALSFVREAADDAAARACADPPTLIAGEPLPLRPLLDRLDIGCGDGLDAVAVFDLPAPSRIELILEGTSDPLASAVAVRRACAAEGDLICAPAGEAIEAALLPAGRYYAIAKAPPGGEPRLRLNRARACADGDCGNGLCVGGLCQDRCRADDDCPGAQTCAAGRCAAPDRCLTDVDCPGLTACEAGACVAFECSTHADCPVACVDRRCADGVPVACGDGAPCPGGLLCAGVGACVVAGDCADDDDCAAGAPRCDTLSGACARCLADGDCDGNGFCEGGVCQYSGFCFAADECPGDQGCGGDGACAPAPCAGDAFDALPLAQRPAVLDRRSYTGLVRCDGAIDTFRVLLADDEGLRVVLRHGPDAGDLRLRLTDSAGRTLEADTPYGAEALAVGAGAGRVDVEVDGAPGRSTPYSLELRALGPDDCPADPSEGLGDNDDPARATRIAPGDRPLGVCPGDVDHFALDVDPGTRLLVDAALEEGGEGLTMALAGPDGELARAEVLDGGDLRLDTVARAGGRHVLRVAGGAMAARGRLSVIAVGAEGGDLLACAEPLEAALDTPLALPRGRPAVDRFTLSCGRGRETEYVVAFDLDAPAVVDVELQGDPIGAAFSIRGDCPDGAGEVVCGERALSGVPLEAGRWFVIVETGPTLGPPALLISAAPAP